MDEGYKFNEVGVAAGWSAAYADYLRWNQDHNNIAPTERGWNPVKFFAICYRSDVEAKLHVKQCDKHEGDDVTVFGQLLKRGVKVTEFDGAEHPLVISREWAGEFFEALLLETMFTDYQTYCEIRDVVPNIGKMIWRSEIKDMLGGISGEENLPEPPADFGNFGTDDVTMDRPCFLGSQLRTIPEGEWQHAILNAGQTTKFYCLFDRIRHDMREGHTPDLVSLKALEVMAQAKKAGSGESGPELMN